MEESLNQKTFMWFHRDHWHAKNITKKNNNERVILKWHPCGSPHHAS